MRGSRFFWPLIFLIILISCKRENSDVTKHVIFRIGFTTDTDSGGPFYNSGFTLQLNDTVSPIFLTAFHVVGGKGNGDFCQWTELKRHVKKAWIWSQHDTSVHFSLEKVIPLQGAKPSHLDLAAFEIKTKDIDYLKPASSNAKVDDTVHLFTKFIFGSNSEFSHPATIVYAGDSAVVYEFITSEKIELNGTSGSPVLNKNDEVVALSFGSLTFPNEKVKENVAKELPLVNELVFKKGKTYAIGVPVCLIKSSLGNAVNP